MWMSCRSVQIGLAAIGVPFGGRKWCYNLVCMYVVDAHHRRVGTGAVKRLGT